MTSPDLATALAGWVENDARRAAARDAILAIAGVCEAMQAHIAGGALVADHGAVVGESLDGDGQKALDVWADAAFVEALGRTGTGALVSEERAGVVHLGGTGGVVVALDPIDGSSNVAVNGPIGTIFSVLPDIGGPDIGGAASFLQPGHAQIAAGYVLFGPQCALALTLGAGTRLFVLDPRGRRFMQVERALQIPRHSNECAINGFNYRHWTAAVRAYVDDCIAGSEGPRGADANTRWMGAAVADVHRILVRGGVYLYPRDARRGYHQGRLRLVYEANPIAFLVEQAGGKAFDGQTRILDLVPTAIHQRVPLIFGSAGEIDRIARYKANPNLVVGRAPLFHRRGLFKGL
ncbi:class 1 fructose-bisphosphatase [Polymorphobacter sp.]|uniref:class 1 fructose-bisphosphatase n=1 Tax=Polymorphobacter sp. TaxID=1909290 RepID=UPI003F6E4A00